MSEVKQRAQHIELVPLDKIILNPKNRNKHAVEQINRLAEIIRYQGFREPGTISNLSGHLCAGEGRYLAAKQLKLTHMPCIYQDFDNEEQEYAYGISTNAIASWAELELSSINVDVVDLGPDFEIDLLGIKDFVLEPADKYGSDPDDVPPVPVQAKSRLGDLWLLGNHRFLCGDSTDRAQVERLMNGEKAVLWSSDPPYGINHVETSQEKSQSQGYSEIQNDDLQFDELKAFLGKVITNSIEIGLQHRFAFYMWHAMKMQSYAAAAAAAAAAAGILFHRQIIWVKPSLVFGRGQYHWRHELCLMGWLIGNECPFYGDRNQTTIWEVGRENDNIHPTQKPIALTEIPVRNHTKPGEIVLDPFLGSGTTLIACEKTNRKCYGMEIDPHYCDVILDRWSKFTGQEPKREDGTPWSYLKDGGD